MYISDLVKRSGRSLRSAKARTLLTALAIAVGGFTLTATLGAGNGIKKYTDRLISSNLDPSELIVARDKDATSFGGGDGKPKEFNESFSSIRFGGDGSSLQFKQVTDDDVNELRKLPFVEQVRENYSMSARYVTREGQKKYTASLMVYNPAQKPEIVAGRLPDAGDLKPGDIIIPEDYISILGLGSAKNAIGQTVIINIQQSFSSESAKQVISQLQASGPTSVSEANLKPAEQTLAFTIVGVHKKPTTTLSPGPLAILLGTKDSRAVYDYESKNTADYGKYLAVLIHVKDGKDEAKLLQAKSNLEANGYFVKTSKDLQQTLNQVVTIFTVLVGVFGVVTLIASVFGIVNTQYISVLERTREIGLMKSLGMRGRDVRRLFMLEAGWIGFLGGVIGTIGGLVLGYTLNPTINRKWGIEFVFRPSQLAILILLLIVVAILAGFLPARKAAKLDPVEALRTE